ncbi:hypothetical protein [Mesonia maritima]|uniref:Uncharacterized protein n=1 Tax=Mesonia maritima TaxID=1793873 RepID=A0ABU1KB00_9FLAO|nr:hypothetical protein [Mesonia maritima]MDR6301652.1 hypothetical protein [Mesonia maritima]
MKIFLISFTFILINSIQLSAQINTKLAPGIDENNEEFMEIFELWKSYLADDPDKIYDSPYWNASEKNHYKSYDLLKTQGFLTPSLYGLNTENVVLYFKKEKDYYIINSMFYWLTNNQMTPLAITKVVAKKDTLGTFKLYNWLPIYTESWISKKVGIITYKYPKSYKLNITEARQANNFVNKLSEIFDLNVDEISYYLFKDCDTLFNSTGFEFIISLGAIPNKCAFFDKINNIVYTIEDSGANHKHELIHLINSKFPEAHYLLLSGLSVYTKSQNSSLGKPFLYHIKKINERIKKNSNLNLTDFNSIKSNDSVTEPIYFIGAIMCDLILQQGGIELLKEALKAGNKDEQLFQFFETCLNLSEKELNDALKKRFSEISEANKMDFLIEY